MSTRPGLLVDFSVLLHDAEPVPGATAYLERMRIASTPVAIIDASDNSSDARTRVLATGLATPLYGDLAQGGARWQPPRPGLLMHAMAQESIDPFRSWLITDNANLLRAAASAGLLGAVWLGEAEPPTMAGLSVNRARDLADAPRVMIPPEGGCWHEHL